MGMLTIAGGIVLGVAALFLIVFLWEIAATLIEGISDSWGSVDPKRRLTIKRGVMIGLGSLWVIVDFLRHL